MGAHDVSFEMPAEATRKQIVERHQELRDEADYNHGHGYSGDWNTIPEIHFHDKEFTDYDEAYEYCLEHAEKWICAIAVRVVLAEGELPICLVVGWAAE